MQTIFKYIYTLYIVPSIAMESINESISRTKPLEVSLEYMNRLSDYIIARSRITIHETVGQGM